MNAPTPRPQFSICNFPRAALLVLILALASIAPPLSAADRPPNIVIIFCDDLGYGDLSCFGHPTIHTPNLDRMALEGQKWTNFYSAAPVCTPSRAALLTGRLPIRSGMCSNTRRVLFPNSKGGIPADEVTIAEMLKQRGYVTGAVGKWHLGHLPQFLPTSNGFDSYFGIPYSNDMDADRDKFPPGANYRDVFREPKIEYWNVPLMRDEQIIERPADQNTITRRYTQEAVKFITANKDNPFFLYLAHSLPHVPLFRSPEFEGRSRRGLYGDVIEEIDWSVGQVLDTLRTHGLAENTIVVFTSDNGPWKTFGDHGGSSGLLRGAKGGTYEGGMREPTIFWSPKLLPGGRVVHDMGSTLDLLPTIAAVTGASAPSDRILDGHDLSAALLGKGASPRDTMFYYHGEQLYALRHGAWKIHWKLRPDIGYGEEIVPEHPALYNLDHDPGEQYDLYKQHPQIVARLNGLAEEHRATVKPVENQLNK